MVQLFQNLLGNAIKYRHPDRRPNIHVTSERLGGEWKFCVADNGIGISPEYQQQIFGSSSACTGAANIVEPV
jgi:signal transduction histidine kinase